MGFNLSWIALDGRSKAAVLDQLGFDEVGDASDTVNAAYSCAELPNGWLILAATDRQFDLDAALATASSEGLVLGCEMSETVMFSRIRGFRNGREIWSVTHDPDKDLRGVALEGDPPAQLAQIRSRAEAQQAADDGGRVDYIFDVPIDLAASLSGYRPDRGAPVDWSVLRPKAAGRNAGDTGPTFISPLIRSQLVPLLRALGWSLVKDHPERFPESKPYDVFRDHGGLRQDMWFDYGAGGEAAPYFLLGFAVWDERAPQDRSTILAGRVAKPYAPVPLWKRLAGMFGKPPPPRVDPLGDVIEQAREHIIAADTFLKGGARHPHVRVERGLAKDSWPALPDGAPAEAG